MELRYLPDSGFVARGGVGPQKSQPRDWLVWHFTHRDNLESIVHDGQLLPAASVTPIRNVANVDVKKQRTYSVRPDAHYPASVVHDHVPFYVTAKSPMLYVVTSPGPESFRAPSHELVFFGVVLGDIIDAGLTWCVSDGNAASAYTQFSREVDGLGDFVDFDLMCQRIWRNTPDDPHRQGRRAAECLVYGGLPLEMVRLVVVRNDEDLDHPRAVLGSVSGERQYLAKHEIFYN